MSSPQSDPRRGWSSDDAERHLLSRERFGMRFGLDRMRRLLNVLGLPTPSFATVHVVGTNGKSSTTRMIAALLAREGLRTACFTSPHLLSYRERIQIGERDIEPERFAAAIATVVHAGDMVDRSAAPASDIVTQFELLTAAALCEFEAAGVEVAVLEAGLGGRYDATNVVDSRVAVLTNVGLEHTRYLGPTIAHIAEQIDKPRTGAKAIASKPIESTYPMAAASPMAPAMLGVPASKRCGGSSRRGGRTGSSASPACRTSSGPHGPGAGSPRQHWTGWPACRAAG